MSSTQPGTVMVDRYRLTHPAPTDLVSAEAWAAHDQILDRAVRVTFVDGPHAAGALDSARRAALVADPRLCRVLDVGTTELAGTPRSYVISEPHTGESLTQIVSRGLVDTQQARAIMGEAASALDVARKRGVHHLALRPEAVRVDGHRVVVTGLGVDSGLAGIEMSGDAAAQRDAQAVAALGYYALTARWPGEDLDTDWISPDAVRPLPAQVGIEGTVPVSDLVPHVEPELDELMRRAFSSEEGLASSADIVSALEPWGQVSVVASLPQFVQPTAESPVRSSVLGVSQSATTPSRPGTPPPAPPVRRPSTGRIARPAAMAGGAAAGAAYGYAAAPGAVPPPPGQAPGYPAAPPQPAAPAATQAYGAPPVPPGHLVPTESPNGAPPSSGTPTTGSFSSAPDPRKKRGVNPTPIVLSLILVGVVIAAIWAITNALQPLNTTAEPAATAPTQEQGAGEPAGGEDGEPDETEEPDEPDVPEVRPVIDYGDHLDPFGNPPHEHPEAVERAYDADPSTFWFTRTYFNNPRWGGFKEGSGYYVRLEEPAPISRIELDTNGSGGEMQLRATSTDDPTGGELLGEGAFEPMTVIELDEPVTTDVIVLWITELPVTDGDFRLELNEITVS